MRFQVWTCDACGDTLAEPTSSPYDAGWSSADILLEEGVQPLRRKGLHACSIACLASAIAGLEARSVAIGNAVVRP